MSESLENQVDRLEKEIAELRSERDHPETEDFFRGVPLEAAHQRTRWGSEHDSGKTPADWFWLVGYLAGKCLASHAAGNQEKALHHTISTAAALANWHLAIKGQTNMRPGIDTPPEAKLALQYIVDGNTECHCEHDSEFCCAKMGDVYCPFCIAATALRSLSGEAQPETEPQGVKV